MLTRDPLSLILCNTQYASRSFEVGTFVMAIISSSAYSGSEAFMSLAHCDVILVAVMAFKASVPTSLTTTT